MIQEWSGFRQHKGNGGSQKFRMHLAARVEWGLLLDDKFSQHRYQRYYQANIMCL